MILKKELRMNKQELIKKYEYMNHDCFRKVDVSEVLADLRQLDEPKQIKLKDVIVRMEGLSEHTRSEWLNDILYKFGSDYGTLKYKDGYEQGKLEGSMIPYEEPQKVTIPQFVADWYEECKGNLEYNIWSYIYNWETKEECDFKNWLDLGRNNPIQTLINMHQFGYEVDKEKRYYVRFKNMESNDFNYLNFIKFQHAWVLSSIKLDKKFRTEHTKKQLEEAGFGWVFDCPGIDIDEVGK